ncbi:hypothetical protein PHYBOEH_004377 [Phytophthora boehmeriae]|uniref:Myosin-like protein n=1 Tax=Phytophthora boehmeriae TaxID=109152 RepID=A0A8T1WLX7_9STRA|nr:hypothetical protein PHYBOEH_004377 [Phytophthora boehmeriae]
MNALKIQKQWRRWRTLRREKQIHRNDEDGKGINVRKESVIQVPDQQSLPAPELNKTSEQLQREQEERQQKLDEILYRFSGRCIARTVSRFHRKNRRQVNAATRIEAIWRGRVCRMQYEEALEAKRQEEARIYLLKLSVFATKVQVCWRQWQVSIRQARRLAVKAEEMRLIEEEKARARKRVVAKQILSSAIQPLMLACTRKMDHAVEDSQACESVEAVGSGQDVGSFQDQIHRENEVESMKVSEKISIRACVDNVVNDWSHRELPHILASTVDRVLSSHDGIVQGQMGELDQDGAHRENEVKPIEAPKEDMTPDGVDEAVKDWSHRQLPYILTSSVNRVLFCQNEDAKGQNGESSQDNEVDSMKVPEKVAGRACVGEVVNDWSCYELPQILMNSVNRVVCCHDEGAKVCIGVPGPDEVQSTKVASNKTSEQLQREQEERQQKLDEILYRFSGRCIARTVSRFHRKNRRQVNAATRIEAIWRGRVCRMQYEEALEAKRQEEARIYLLKLSVFATKVQVCWRQWQVSIRQARRLAVKAEEMRLIEEEKARARKRVVARRISAAMRIQPLLLACTRKMDHADEDSNVAELSQVAESSKDDVRKEAKDEAQDDEGVELMKVVEEDVIRDSVDEAVKDWSHRELPHILTSSVNRVIFCHDGAVVLQRFVRGCQRRNLLHFYFQRPLPISDLGNDGEANFQHFHFYFKRSKAWLELGRHKQHGNLSSTALPDSSSDLPSRLRLRFDGQMTRKLLQMFEPDAAHSTCELKEALREIAADACPIFQSPACLQSNSSPTLNLRYHEVGETDLPHFIALMREMSKRRAQVRRDQLLEVDTQAMAISPVVSSPSSPLSSAPSSPMLSQRTKREPTIFDAVENASVEEVIFLQKRSADLGAIEPKTQRNALHMLAFSTESYRFRAEMLEFLLRSEVNLNVNATDCHGDTPLMLYASMGHLEFMKELLKRGADIQLTNAKGQNVLHRACEKDQVEICGFLQQLMMAKKTVTGGATTAETISALPLGFSLHSPDSTGRYPLHILVEQGFVECAKQLLVPAEVNTEWNGLIQAQSDEQGRTALHLAVLAHDAGMTTFLLLPGGGADIDAIDDLRRTPLHYAVESPAALPIISRLAQQGADLNMADERGDTPLHWAAFSGRTAVMQHLLSLGADPTLVNSDWESPAQIAAAYGQLDGMRILLQAQRRYEAASKAESMEQQRPPTRLASEKTVFERLEEAQNEVHQKQAAQSFRASAVDSSPDAASSNAPRSAQPPISGYWEELHQDVQLVEESGQFSSEDEADLLFDHDSDDDIPTF